MASVLIRSGWIVRQGEDFPRWTYPQRGWKRRQVGTIVEDLAPGVCEVDFSHHQGRTYASAALHAEHLMRLYHEPAEHAAQPISCR